MTIPQNSDQTLDTSYTAMQVGDVEAIGAHCQDPFCRQLDFLPFRCESCKGSFCSQHRTEDAHNCPNKGAWSRARREREPAVFAPSAPKPTILNHDRQCASPSCKTLIDTPLTPSVHCSSCNRDYCLKHRLVEDHECDKIPRPKLSDGGVANALGKLRAWGTQKRAAAAASAPSKQSPSANVTAPLSRSATDKSLGETSPKLFRIISPFSSRKPKSGSAATSHVMQLKRSAKGDAKIPQQQRLYVHLEAVASGEGASGAKVPRTDAFFSKEWSVGKVLDSAAKTLQVANVNNRGGGEEEKLRVFSVEGGRLLAFTEKLGQDIKDGDTLVLLRGVGAPL